MSDGHTVPIESVDGRTCGDCSLCCKLLAVGKPGEDFEKEQGEWCEHVCADKHGCKLQDAKPTACEEFRCSWLSGAFREEDRPDKSRVVVCLEDSIAGSGLTDATGRQVLAPTPIWCVYEREPGAAFAGKRARAILDELRTMCVRHEQDGEFHGPFPTGIIPSKRHTRMIRLPRGTRWVPCYREGEDPDGYRTG